MNDPKSKMSGQSSLLKMKSRSQIKLDVDAVLKEDMVEENELK